MTHVDKGRGQCDAAISQGMLSALLIDPIGTSGSFPSGLVLSVATVEVTKTPSSPFSL